MSLQLILGNSGSGKSHELYKTICTASVQSPGTQFLVIVPEQFTMQTQKELVALHPKKGILNIDILSFQRLAHRIFEEVGADRRTVLEEIGKTLLLRRTSGKHQDELKVLKGNLKKKGYLSQVKSMISELAQYDITRDKMDRMLEVSQEKPQLFYKLQDIKVLYDAFREELSGKYITAEETLDALCQVAEESQILKNSVIALDGFTGFTPIQQKLIERLLTLADQVYVTVTIDAGADFYRIYGEHELFYLSKKTIHSLTEMAKRNGCEIREPVILPGTNLPRFRSSKELGFLEQHLFRSGKTVVYHTEENRLRDISIHVVKNPSEEIRFVGRTIRKLIRQGYRYQDMAIITGNMESYENELASIMEEYEVPVFMDQTRSVVSNPFIELIRAVLDMVEQDYTRDSVFRVLRTGLCQIETKDCDDLENYVYAAGIRGHKKWSEEFTGLPYGCREEDLNRMNEIREKVSSMFEAFRLTVHSSKTNTREKTTALYELISSLQIQEQLQTYETCFEETGEQDLQKEYAQIYRMVMELFDKMVELLGEENLTLREYTEILETGFEELKVGIIPPSADRVPVGTIERTRLKNIRVLFFIGLNDGWVPQNKSAKGLLSDLEREKLKSSKVELAPTSRQDSYVQRFYLYLNLTRPSEKLYLSYVKSEGQGETMHPSYVVHTLETLFPSLQIVDEDRRDTILERAQSPESGMHLLVEGMQKLKLQEPSLQWLELYNWYRRQDEYQKKTEELLDAAFLTFQEESIGKEAAHRLYGEILTNSVSRLEKFAGCAFAHFLQYGLRLQERNEYTFRPMDLGQIIHKVIEQFTRKVEQEGCGWKFLTQERRDELIDECVDQITEEYGQKILHSTSRNEHMIERIRRILRRTAWALQEQLSFGHFTPVNTEVAFSQIADLKAVNLSLSEEERMRLKGRIDRIDICEKDKEVLVKIIDYKSGNTDFDLAALYYGLQLQLVVYLNAAMEMEQRTYPDKEIVPAGIFYYHVKDPVLDRKEEETEEELKQEMLKSLKPGGLVNSDPAVYRELDDTFEKTSLVIPVALKKDGSFTKGSSIASKEQFHTVSSYVNTKMKEIGRKIMEGDIAAVPYQKGEHTGCDFCVYKEICRMDKNLPGTHYARMAEYADEEIWSRMENQINGNTMDEGTA